MLSAIIQADEDGARLPGLLAILTAGVVEGLVREAAIAGGGPSELLQVLREETGAELHPDLRAAIAAARSDLLLVLGAAFRPRLGWVEALALHLKGGGREAVLAGEGGGFLKPGPFGVVIPRAKAASLAHPDLKQLRRSLGHGAARIG